MRAYIIAVMAGLLVCLAAAAVDCTNAQAQPEYRVWDTGNTRYVSVDFKVPQGAHIKVYANGKRYRCKIVRRGKRVILRKLRVGKQYRVVVKKKYDMALNVRLM